MQAKETTVQSLCGKRRRVEERNTSEPPSKFPKLNNESILTSINNNDEIESLSSEGNYLFAETSPLPEFEDLNLPLFENEIFCIPDDNFDFNFPCNNEVKDVNDDSDIAQEDTSDNENDVEEYFASATTNDTANFTSNLNLSSNSEMNRDESESEGQRNSDAPEMVDNIDDSIKAEIACNSREENHAPFEVTDEFKKLDWAENSFAFAQEKIGKQREFQITVLEKSCTGVTPSLRGPTGYFNVKCDPYSRDKRKSLHFNCNNLGIDGIVKKFKFYLQNVKGSHKNVQNVACTLDITFTFENADPIVVTLDNLYVANHKYESGKIVKALIRPVRSTVVVTKNCVKIVNQ